MIARLTVLFVEDHDELREAIARALDRLGWQVTTSPSLTDARRVLLQRRFDALLVDRHLPDGDGATLLERGIPLVLLTGDDRAVPGALVLVKGDLTYGAIDATLREAHGMKYRGDREPITDAVTGGS
jgi:DNA-binding LacI/PurR family transcriptional regulator